MYLKAVDGNCLMLKPAVGFSYIVALWVFLQIFLLKVQHTKPNVLLPRLLLPYIMPNYYKYERTFDAEADRTSHGLFRSMEREDEIEEPEQAQGFLSTVNQYLGRYPKKKTRRIQKLKKQTCSICLHHLGREPIH